MRLLSLQEGLSDTNPMGPFQFKEVKEAFFHAAQRAKEAGYDAIQIHAAHGYLLSQSLSPLENRRTDSYGGALKNRMRFLLEVVQAVRKAVGPSYPIFAKLNSSDEIEGGFTLEDALAVANALEKEGIDAVEVSGGTPESKELGPIRTRIDQPLAQGYFQKAGQAFKESLSIPVLLVGGIRTLAMAKNLVSKKCCDLISLSRPLVREPGLVRRWEEGIEDPATCVSCCRCFIPARKGEGLSCPRKPKNPL